MSQAKSIERRSEAPVSERRFLATKDLRVERRSVAGGEAKPAIVGHASVFDVWTTLYEGRYWVWREIVRPGAYARAIKEGQDVRCLFNHDANIVIGRTTSGTLRLAEDREGLAIDCDPPDTQLIRDMVLSPIERKDITGQSFAFMVKRSEKTTVVEDGDTTVIDCGGERITIRREGEMEIEERELLDLDLLDVSPVTYPQYPETDVALRSLIEQRDRPRHERRGTPIRDSAARRIRLAQAL